MYLIETNEWLFPLVAVLSLDDLAYYSAPENQKKLKWSILYPSLYHSSAAIFLWLGDGNIMVAFEPTLMTKLANPLKGSSVVLWATDSTGKENGKVI